jgi:fructose-bisphosphate aldolase class 1
MRNQFFYTRKEGDDVFTDSFNINKVIRTVKVEDDKLLVLLDDLHERTVEMPDISVKTNKVIGTKKQRNTYQSEIYLEGDDIQRFIRLTEIN